jgi:hypothetical protein
MSDIPYPYKNPIHIDDSSYNGYYYAYEASGGFSMERGVGNITIQPYSNVKVHDVTNSLQIKYDVREFNKKLGLYKDASNLEITETSYDILTNTFLNDGTIIDSISLPAGEFSTNVVAENIISVGRYYTAYSEFNTLLNNYFQLPDGFATFFSGTTVFDASAMVQIMNSSEQNASGEYVNTMTGTITINKVNDLLRYAYQYNPFNNRETETVSIENGFIENDLIYIPTGTTVTLVANIINEVTSGMASEGSGVQNPVGDYMQVPFHNELPDTAILQEIRERSPPLDDTTGDYSQVTTFYTDQIVRILKVPILIILKNLSTE